MRLVEKAQIVAGFVPADMAAAAQNGDWVTLRDYNHLAIVFFKAAGAGAEDPVITVQQATDVAGTGAKALTFTTAYRKSAADVTTIGQFTKVTQAAANTFTVEGGEQAIVVIEFDAEELDVTGGFDCVRATVADVGATAQIGSLLYVLTEGRYGQAALPSAIA